MIVSASRRTDIPAFYSDWLLRRMEEGFADTRNPFNHSQTRRVSLLPGDVDCLVLWTKDPRPLVEQLPRLEEWGVPFYFQFTLTPYGKELEPGLRDKDAIVETFRELSRRAGPERVRWRYDPIVLSEEWTIGRHKKAFEGLCGRLAGRTESVTVSFVDLYAKVRSSAIRAIGQGEMEEMAAAIAEIAAVHGLTVYACCEKRDFSHLGVLPAACIDRDLIEKIKGWPVSVKADRNQRPGCGCAASVDIGAYNTCGHGCVYCYASHSPLSVEKKRRRHDPYGTFLIGD